MTENTQQHKSSSVKYTDPKKKYMITIAPNYSVEEKEKLLGPNS